MTEPIRIVDGLGIRGHFEGRLIDPHTGEVVRSSESGNLVTLIGREGARDGTWPNLTHMALGDDGTAAAAGNTALGNEIYRSVFTSTDLAQTGKAVYKLVLGSTVGNGNTFREAGLFDASSGGNLFARVTYDDLVKTADVVFQGTWTVLFQNVS